MNPNVSVVTAAYNAEKTIQDSMRSVLEQDYEDIELIVILNGCTDNTENLVKEIQKLDNRVRILTSEKGKVPARNTGFLASKGKIIALNDADDIWLPGKLKQQVKEIENGFTVVASKIECINSEGIISKDPLNRPTRHPDIVHSMLCGVNPIANSTAIFEKRLINHTGIYDDCFPFCEDYHFWLRSIKFAKFKNMEDVHVRYFSHPDPNYDPQIPIALSSFYKSLYNYTGVCQ
jgi:glycosyltransferase involved in cell wall biosynthesis